MGAERPFKGGLSPPATCPLRKATGQIPFNVGKHRHAGTAVDLHRCGAL